MLTLFLPPFLTEPLFVTHVKYRYMDSLIVFCLIQIVCIYTQLNNCHII